MPPLEVVILAAGQGTRMKSARPKVLHELAGKPMLAHVLAAASVLRPRAVHIVHGHASEAVQSAFADAPVRWVLQHRQLGTGHAVREALPGIDAEAATVLVLFGDVPMIDPQTLAAAVQAADGGALCVVSAQVADPSGYGRIIRNACNEPVAIREHRDASESERCIGEINSGIMAAPCGLLRRWLDALGAGNDQGELYLTDTVAAAVGDGVPVQVVSSIDELEIAGVNDRVQLAALERAYQSRCAAALMRGGVTIADPGRFDVRGSLSVGRDVFIDVNAVFEGEVSLGDDVRIGPNCYIKDSAIGDKVEVLANTVIEEAVVEAGARVGPFARLRPESRLGAGVHVGNFVEVKKSTLASGAKVNHLSYVGDSEIGARVNVGAGTITCNYDGANKHRTVIEDDAFIGSGTMLVAPLTVGKGATIGAGTTLSRDAPAEALTYNRAPRKVIEGWRRPEKKRP